MALNPEISLGIRPPQIAPLQLQTPLDRYQRMLTLRHLMTQQQTGALNLEQTRLENEALREKAVQFREQTAREAQFRQRASQLQPDESIAPGEAYEFLGPEAGGDLLRTQAQEQVATNNLRIQQLEKLQAAAAASTDQASLTRNVMQLINAKVLPWQMAREILDVPFDLKAVQEAGMAALNRKDQLLAENAELERQYLTKIRPLQVKEQEQKVEGTQPITPQQTAQAEAQLWSDPGGLIAIMNDPKRPAADKQRAAAGLQKHEDLRRAGATTMMITPNQTIGNESKLRDDYSRDTKDYVAIRNAYSKITSAARASSAVGDMSLVFGLMKLQDPGSTVRENEQADARNTAGVPEIIRNTWNRLRTGERLSPEQRADMVARAKEIYADSFANYGKTREMYTGIATRGGMDPRNVVIDLSPATPPAAKKHEKGSDPGGLGLH